MKVLTTTSQKGGVGKTTLADFLTLAFAKMGRRVLLVDLDHNNNSTDLFLREADVDEIEARSVYQFFTGKLTLPQVSWHITDNIDFIPATPLLSRLGIELAQDLTAPMRFQTRIRNAAGYDYIILDTHNGLNYALSAALCTCDLVLCPVSAQRWTAKGYGMIVGELTKVAESFGRAPEILAVPSIVSPTEAASLQASTIWTATKTAIHKDPSIGRAINGGRELREGTISSSAFLDLARELEERLGERRESA